MALLSAFAGLASGGPVDGSRIMGGGAVEFEGAAEIDLESEALSFVIVGDTVTVEATFVLVNSGPERLVGFSFPVDYVSDCWQVLVTQVGESVIPPEVLDFSIALDGEALAVDAHLEDTGRIVIEGDSCTLSTCWFTAALPLGGWSRDTLVVDFGFEPFFIDYEEPYELLYFYGPRSFDYRLDPAGLGGDGFVDSLTWMIDISAVIGSCDDFSLPPGGSWSGDGIYSSAGSGICLADAEPIAVSYEVANRHTARFIRENRIDPGSFTSVRVSSVKPPDEEGSYGPENLFDLDLGTSWNPGTLLGLDSWIEIGFDTCAIGGILLASGDWIDPASYETSGRVAKVMLILDGTREHDSIPGDFGGIYQKDSNIRLLPEWVRTDGDGFAAGLVEIEPRFYTEQWVGSIRIIFEQVDADSLSGDLLLNEVVILRPRVFD